MVSHRIAMIESPLRTRLMPGVRRASRILPAAVAPVDLAAILGNAHIEDDAAPRTANRDQHGNRLHANLDGRVLASDFSLALANWQGTQKGWAQGDFNADGTVQANDLSLLLGNFGYSRPGSQGMMAGGNLAGASEVLREALRLAPDLAKAHFFTGVTLKGEGRYDEALRHLKRASDQYPRDRVVLNTIGRIHFLKRSYREAVSAFERVLRIDPEDLTAHYNLMLCYQGLGDQTSAARERTLYQRFKADESSQAITGPYRRLHPEDNNERQQIHEHRSVPLAPASSLATGNRRRGGKLIARGNAGE